MKVQLNTSVKRLSELIISDPSIESAFLGALGNMEEVAAREIIKTIGPTTPKEHLLEIISHAQDEHRHAFQLRGIKPIKDYCDVRYYQLERILSELGINFVLGFFGQKILLKARSLDRFAGYILGAMTIEQVPLQLYTGYLKATKIESVRKNMPLVLKDEFAHLELGKKLYKTLPLEQQFSIDEINAIELEMCDLLARKMYTAIENFKNLGNPREPTFEEYLSADTKRLALWISLLSQVESERGRKQIASELLHSVLFITNKMVDTKNLNVQDAFKTLSKAAPDWLQNHYQTLADKTSLIGLCYALEKAAKNYDTEEILSDAKSFKSNIHQFNAEVRRHLESVL